MEATKGKPLANVKVILNGKPIGITKEDGGFVLEKIKAGTHKISVEAGKKNLLHNIVIIIITIISDNLLFEEKTLKIKPTDGSLPDLIPSKYKICGSVISDLMQKVSIKNLETSDILSTTTDPQNGKFCVFLSPGKYDFQVALSERERNDGLQ